MSTYTIVPSGKFRKDIKKYFNKPKEKEAIYALIDLLAQNGHSAIPKKMKPHKLSGSYSGYWE